MAEQRFVEVAVDAPGVPGGRAFSYLVPPGLSDIEAGEAVMVEFGRRRAVGVILAEAAEPEMQAKPLLARVRSDGVLLGPLWRRLALHVAAHYLAPPGMVVRAMLPPGTLERIELFAVPTGESSDDALAAAVTAAGAAGVRVDELPASSSRATLLRNLRALEVDGIIQGALVAVGPEVLVGGAVNQLNRDPHPVAIPKNGSLHDPLYAQLFCQDWHGLAGPIVLDHGGAGKDSRRPDLAQLGDQLLMEAGREVLPSLVFAEVFQGKNGKGPNQWKSLIQGNRSEDVTRTAGGEGGPSGNCVLHRPPADTTDHSQCDSQESQPGQSGS